MKKFFARLLPLVLCVLALTGLLASCGEKRLSVQLVLPDPLPEGIDSVEIVPDSGTTTNEDGKTYYEGAETIWLRFECLVANMPGEVTLTLEGEDWDAAIENAAVEREEGVPPEIDGQPGYYYRTEALNIGGRTGDSTLTASFKSVAAQFDASFDVRGKNENSALVPGEVPSFDDVKTVFEKAKFTFSPHVAIDKETGKYVVGGTKFGEEILTFAEYSWSVASNGGIDFKMELPLGNDLTPYKAQLDDMFALYRPVENGWDYADQTIYRTTSVANAIFEWKFSGFDNDFLINIDLNILHAVLLSLQTPAA